MDFTEIDFETFLLDLFDNEPKNKNSILVNLDASDIVELFERLLSIFHNGSKILYGDEFGKVDLLKMSFEDFELINKYFNSFGIELHFKKFEELQISKYKNFITGIEKEYKKDLFTDYSPIELKDLINYKDSNSNLLEDLRFQLRVSRYVFVISFSFCINN